MSKIKINDLPTMEDLNETQTKGIMGGYSFYNFKSISLNTKSYGSYNLNTSYSTSNNIGWAGIMPDDGAGIMPDDGAG